MFIWIALILHGTALLFCPPFAAAQVFLKLAMTDIPYGLKYFFFFTYSYNGERDQYSFIDKDFLFVKLTIFAMLNKKKEHEQIQNYF